MSRNGKKRKRSGEIEEGSGYFHKPRTFRAGVLRNQSVRSCCPACWESYGLSLSLSPRPNCALPDLSPPRVSGYRFPHGCLLWTVVYDWQPYQPECLLNLLGLNPDERELCCGDTDLAQQHCGCQRTYLWNLLCLPAKFSYKDFFF